VEKVCTKCGAEKPLDEFHRFANARDGRRAECKECSCARARARYDPDRWDTGPVSGVCAYEPCGKPFEYVKTTGRRRMYCSDQCRYRAGEKVKKDRAATSTRACACGSTDVARVGKPVCHECKKDKRGRTDEARVRERRRILRLYNITQADYDAMIVRQGSRCAVPSCRTDTPGGHGENWKIDHDHACCPGKGSCGRCVRGLTCNNCNLAMGFAADDPGRLRGMADYIEAARQPALFIAAA
jgi:hypothetical protein